MGDYKFDIEDFNEEFDFSDPVEEKKGHKKDKKEDKESKKKAPKGKKDSKKDEGSESDTENKKETTVLGEILSWVIPFAVAIAVVILLKRFVIINANVPTGSMEDTIMTGDNLIGNRLAYTFSEPKRGDVVIFYSPLPEDQKEKLIKRVIGLPGETIRIENYEVYIDGKLYEEDYLKETWARNPGYIEASGYAEFTLGEDEYFMMGDNRNNSYDGRYWAEAGYFVNREDIIGKGWFIYWPIKHFSGL